MTDTKCKAPIDHGTTTDPNWTAPGAGTWELDTTHFSPNCSRLARDLLEASVAPGFEVGLTMVGGPIRTIDAHFINGRYFIRIVPLVGAGRNLPMPPAPILWLTTHLHPEFRRRSKRAAKSMADRIWMQEYQRWQDEWKPQLAETNTRFGAVSPEALDDADLGRHMTDLYAHLLFSTALHFRLHTSDLGPIGLMLVKGSRFGLEGPALMSAMTGASPATVAPGHSLARLRELTVGQGVTPSSFDEIRAVSAECAALLAEYLDVYGSRLTTGYDLQDRTLGELPQVVLAALRVAGDQRADEDSQRVGDVALEELLGRVPDEHRSEMRTIIEDARSLYGLRDENGPYTYEWPMGIMRRAVLEAQKRLKASGCLVQDEGVFDLSLAEMTDLLAGAGRPSPQEIERRRRERAGWANLEAPAHLGPAPVVPPTSVMPGPLKDMMEGVLVVTEQIESAVVWPALHGLGIGTEPYIGRARVVQSADEAFGRMEPGDVLVAPYTVPTYNAILAIAGAVVVENGGLLCHAAVIAREFGIAGLVGASQATADIPDGAMVEVDPVAGVVRVLAAVR